MPNKPRNELKAADSAIRRVSKNARGPNYPFHVNGGTKKNLILTPAGFELGTVRPQEPCFPGLANLTNAVAGTFYGLVARWGRKTQRKLGAFLLYKAFHIFLQEGEREIKTSDINLRNFQSPKRNFLN